MIVLQVMDKCVRDPVEGGAIAAREPVTEQEDVRYPLGADGTRPAAPDDDAHAGWVGIARPGLSDEHLCLR